MYNTMVCFVLSDSLKLYLVQMKAGDAVRELGAGEFVEQEENEGGRV